MTTDGQGLISDVDTERVVAALEWAGKGPHDDEPSIAAALAPGGLVFQTWANGELLAEDRMTTPDDGTAGEAAGQRAVVALDAGAKAVELRIFDGDTGAWVMTRQMGTKP